MIAFAKPKNKRLFIAAVAMLVLGVLGLVLGIYFSQLLKADAEDGTSPNFNSLIPKGESIEQLGDWQKLTPPEGGDPAWVFVDEIDGVAVQVSQQVLPGTLKADPDNRIAELARSGNYNTKLDVDGTKVYIGTSAKGPQSVMFTKNGLFVLIKSWSAINNDAWTSYISSLQ
ncbi:hypothetical protein B7Z17_02515 [Candidatus Saccharibacteria bacterium 32-49-10]|nr:MAG: hypothetical protein B7Z17_02515 [Candidatus Saccharibacteria bacterium 32-49-10]